MQGNVAIAGEASYEGARQVFNGAVDRWPTLFAFCESARDVQEAVRAARAYGLPLSVRGGGHDWVGRALSHHGLVVDLSRMRNDDGDQKILIYQKRMLIVSLDSSFNQISISPYPIEHLGIGPPDRQSVYFGEAVALSGAR